MKKLILTENQIRFIMEGRTLKPKPIIRRVLSQKEMVQLGGNYHLSKGVLMWIPVNMIDGLDPEPSTWQDDEGIHNFIKGQKIIKPIEVIYNSDNNVFYLQDGNHRVKQAKLNGDLYIKAFVEAEDDKQYLKLIR